MTDEASYVLVPREPTEAMLLAAATAYRRGVQKAKLERDKLGLNSLNTVFPVSWLDRVYAAMLAASPVTGDVDRLREAIAKIIKEDLTEQHVYVWSENPDDLRGVGVDGHVDLLSLADAILALVRGEG